MLSLAIWSVVAASTDGRSTTELLTSAGVNRISPSRRSDMDHNEVVAATTLAATPSRSGSPYARRRRAWGHSPRGARRIRRRRGSCHAHPIPLFAPFPEPISLQAVKSSATTRMRARDMACIEPDSRTSPHSAGAGCTPSVARSSFGRRHGCPAEHAQQGRHVVVE